MAKRKIVGTKKMGATLQHHSLPVDLEPGKRVHVKLVKAGYAPQEFYYTVPASAATVTKTMYHETGTLSVTTTPTSATIKIGTETRTSPCIFTLAPGTYTVTISKAGYDTITDSVTITSGATTVKSYTLTLLNVTITFDTKDEAGAKLTGVDVIIDGVKRGST